MKIMAIGHRLLQDTIVPSGHIVRIVAGRGHARWEDRAAKLLDPEGADVTRPHSPPRHAGKHNKANGSQLHVFGYIRMSVWGEFVRHVGFLADNSSSLGGNF